MRGVSLCLRGLLFLCVSALVLFLLPLPAAAQQEEAGLTLEVSAGYDGICRQRAWCPVRIVVANEGDAIEGELRVEVRGTSMMEERHVYGVDVSLPTHSRKVFFLYLPGDGAAVYREVHLFSERRLLASASFELAWTAGGNRLYGVAGSAGSLQGLLGGGAARVVRVELEALPDDPLGWEALDVLVLNDVDTTALDPARQEALAAWLAHGGRLVVGGGGGAARTAAGLGDLLPVEIGGTRTVDGLEALGALSGAETSPGPYVLAEAALVSGGEALVEQDGLLLAARRRVGLGWVDFLAFDAGLDPFEEWENGVALWEWIVAAEAERVGRIGVSDGGAARDVVYAVPGVDAPSAGRVLGFLLAYTALVGPVNYVVLRRLDRREWAWLTVPLLVAGFTAAAYLTGFSLRGSRAIVHRVAVVVAPEGGPARVSQLVGVFSPRRTTYDVHAAGAGVRAVESSGYYYAPEPVQPLHLVRDGDGQTVADLRVDIGGVQPLVVEGYAPAAMVTADLGLVVPESGRPRVEGTVRNDGVRLEDAVLVMGGARRSLGDLEAGASESVTLPARTALTANSDLMQHVMGGRSTYGYYGGYDEETWWRYEFLEAISFSPGSDLLDSYVYLFGWSEGAPLPVEVEGRPYDAVERALYVYVLAVRGVEPGEAAEVGGDQAAGEAAGADEGAAGGDDGLNAGAEVQVEPPVEPGEMVVVGSDQIAREVTKDDDHVVENGRLYMRPEDRVEYRFTIPAAVLPARVDEMALRMAGLATQEETDRLIVSLWSVAAQDWEQIDYEGESVEVPHPGDYVSSSGVVLLRLEVKVVYSGFSMVTVDHPTIEVRGRR